MSYQYNELICVSGNLGAVTNAAKTVFFPCDHFGNGCRALLLAKEKLDHERNCEFGRCVCPYPGGICEWTGPVEHVVHHLMTMHKNLATFQGDDHVILAKDVHIAGPLDWQVSSLFMSSSASPSEKQYSLGFKQVCSPFRVVIQSCFGHNFIAVLGKQYHQNGEEQYHALVQLVGSREDSQKFCYRLELSAGQYRRLVWNGTTRSIHDGIISAIESGDCFLFDSKTVEICAENQSLQMRVIVSPVQQDDVFPQFVEGSTSPVKDPAVTLHYLPIPSSE
ncbi:E3 ubiquitin-protein ligase sina [Orchesella cincta]|uniref:E3 ubiquitin-protein ligase n=1 Tax=Orchesella cincta TaxID=48709 RepID=A0A1D2ME48_ORCCI|nr:E3 ubiquitin-protein ligase sina [Orchesella cincta]